MSSSHQCIRLAALLLLGVSSGHLIADGPSIPTRAGYSYFGLGANFIDYEESSALRIGDAQVDVETDTTVNVAQQSGTYVAINPDWGFYLVSSSTIGESRSDEQWVIDDVIVQSNRLSFEQQRLGFVFSRHHKKNNYFLFGAQYNNTEFERFGTTLEPGAAQFGISEPLLESGTESENVLELSVVAGWERNTFFSSTDARWHYLIQAIVGVPLLTSISNTRINDGETQSEAFNGFSSQFRLTYGYQFSRNLVAAVNLEFALSWRDAIDRGVSDAVGITEFPKNTLIYLFPSLALYWSF